MKRVFDILVSFFCLIVFFPMFLFISICILYESRGPIFFRGLRTGRNGKEFAILKFRTMYEKPKNENGLPVTTKDDKRVTSFGRWLRDTKFNELPQLWNVFKGEMSLVGPRPEDPEIVLAWHEDIRKEVLSVRPGMTSPASVIFRDEEQLLTGLSAMDLYLQQILPQKLRLDQLYVRTRSFIGDLDIIFLTVIMLLPRVRTVKIHEKILFSGPFYNFINRYLSWFVIDIIVALIAITVSGFVWRINFPLDLGIIQAASIAITIAFLLGSINYLLGLGRIIWRNASLIYVLDLGLSTGATVLILVLVNLYYFKQPIIPTGLIINFGLLTFLGLVLVRYRERLLIMLADRWINFRGNFSKIGDRVLIVGAGNCGQLTAWLLQKSIYFNLFSITGFVDDDYQKQGQKILGYPVLGTIQDISKIVEKKKIGVIFICISKCSPSEHQRILLVCRSTPARVAIIPDLNDVLERSILESNLGIKQ
jgi:lipopolysaccharide/colanic/teichoic acid biosynthesis glycosyltransferase